MSVLPLPFSKATKALKFASKEGLEADAKAAVKGIDKVLEKEAGDAAKGVVKTIDNVFDINKLDSFKNANITKVEKYLDHTLEGFTKSPLKKGEGVRYFDGKGNSYQLNYGYENASNSIHGGPYLKTTRGSEIIRIPLIK